MNLEKINKSAKQEIVESLLHCCHSQAWALGLLACRPFVSKQELLQASSKIWFSLTEKDWLEAFLGHPQIGDLASSLAVEEQGQVAQASIEILHMLAKKNKEYLEKFGFIFIVCATGKSADEMLQIILKRLPNSRNQELGEAAKQQDLIIHLRLEKLS